MPAQPNVIARVVQGLNPDLNIVDSFAVVSVEVQHNNPIGLNMILHVEVMEFDLDKFW